MKLLEIAKKFGVKPSKVIGTQGNIVPFKKPSLVDVRVDEFKLKDSIDQGAITMDKVKQEMEETVKLALSKNLNDVELNRALNNAINIDRQFFPPAADVYKLGVGEKLKGKGLEELIQKEGRKYKPTSLAGEIETTGKQLENVMDDMGKQFGVGDKTNLNIDTIIKDAAKGQLSLSRLQNEGLVRATARQILIEDIKAGKIKDISISEAINMKEPIDPFRKIYGEDALERLDSLAPDFNRLTSEQEAAKLARSKFTIEPKEVPVDESMTYDELGNLIKKGPDEPETKADGGRIGYAKGKRVISSIDKLLEQLNTKLSKKTSMETVDQKTGEVTIPKKPIKRAEEPTGVTVMDQEPIIRTTEDIEKEIDELSTTPITTLEKKRKYNDLHSEFINSLDPRRQKKALDYRRKSLDMENRLLLKAEEQGLDFDTFEKLRQGLYGPRKQQTLNYIKTGKVNIEPVKPATTFEEVQNRYRTAAKAADEIFPNYNNPKTAANELANVMAEQKYGKVFDDISGDKQSDLYSEAYDYITSVNKLPKVSPANVPPQVLERKMNEVLNSYDKSMFIKNEQGMVDVTNPENIAKMEELLRKDHPELHNQLKKLTEDVSQKETLLDFDITGRKPNSKGGIAGLIR